MRLFHYNYGVFKTVSYLRYHIFALGFVATEMFC